MEQKKQASSQIKANPISNQTIQESDVNVEQNEVQEQIQQRQEEQGQEQVKKHKFLKPDFIYCPNNKSMDALIKTYPHLQSLRDNKTTKFEEVTEAESYVIRSNNDDDIHKAIKYGVWCSTPPNNEMLDAAFKAAQAENKDIYLFYSVVKSGQFVGVAKLKSALNEETFAYWWQHSKWRGYFKIEWLFIKDIVYKQFESLKNEHDMPVIRSKDGTKIDWKETGLPMILKYQEAKDEPSIFQDFEHMDQREQFQRYIRGTSGNAPQYNQYPQQQQQYYNQQYYQQQQYYGAQYQQQYYYPQQFYNNAFPPQNNNQQFRGYNNNNNNNGGFKKPYYKKNNNYNNQNNGYRKNYHNNRNGYNKNNQQSQQKPEQQQKE